MHWWWKIRVQALHRPSANASRSALLFAVRGLVAWPAAGNAGLTDTQNIAQSSGARLVARRSPGWAVCRVRVPMASQSWSDNRYLKNTGVWGSGFHCMIER